MTTPAPIQLLARVRVSVLTIDMESFSRPEHDDWAQVRLRARLYRALHETLRQLPGRAATGCDVHDRGDGALVLIPSVVTLTDVVRVTVRELPRALSKSNAGQSERIRIRGAIHAGWATYDRYGVSGTAINYVCHLQQSDVLRQRLAGAPGDVVIVLSDDVFTEVVQRGGWSPPPPGLEPMAFVTKRAKTRGWVYVSEPATSGAVL